MEFGHVRGCMGAPGSFGSGAGPGGARLRYQDLPASIERRFDAKTFDARTQALERETTERRRREGEFDHLIYYALQSQRFTQLPWIEPALSARELMERRAVPRAARARLMAFLGRKLRPQSARYEAYYLHFKGQVGITMSAKARHVNAAATIAATII
jgi:hypothetical protein